MSRWELASRNGARIRAGRITPRAAVLAVERAWHGRHCQAAESLQCHWPSWPPVPTSSARCSGRRFATRRGIALHGIHCQCAAAGTGRSRLPGKATRIAAATTSGPAWPGLAAGDALLCSTGGAAKLAAHCCFRRSAGDWLRLGLLLANHGRSGDAADAASELR